MLVGHGDRLACSWGAKGDACHHVTLRGSALGDRGHFHMRSWVGTPRSEVARPPAVMPAAGLRGARGGLPHSYTVHPRWQAPFRPLTPQACPICALRAHPPPHGCWSLPYAAEISLLSLPTPSGMY